MIKKLNILIVDDEQDVGSLLKIMLKNHNNYVENATSFEKAQKTLLENTFEVIFLDLNINMHSGFDLIPYSTLSTPGRNNRHHRTKYDIYQTESSGKRYFKIHWQTIFEGRNSSIALRLAKNYSVCREYLTFTFKY